MPTSLLRTLAVVSLLGSIACDDDDPPPPGGDPLPGDPGPSGPSCPWQGLGTQVSPSTAESEDPSMLLAGTTPAVGYRHASFEINLHTWNGTGWDAVGSDPSSGDALSSIYRAPDFCHRGDEIFVAFGDAGDSGASDGTFYNRIFVYRWTSSGGWVVQNNGEEVSQLWSSGSGIGYDAWEAAIACRTGSDPAVSWIETDIAAEEDIDAFVARVTATTVTRSGRINRVAANITDNRVTDVEIASDGTAYVAQLEHVADASFATALYVTRADGTSLGGAIDQDEDSNNLSAPSLAIDGTDIYVAWSADRDDSGTRHVYVASWNGTAWNPVGSGPVSAFSAIDHYDSGNPDLIVADGTLTLAWDEADQTTGQYVYVARWNGTTWDVLCGAVNVDPSRDAMDPSLAFDSGSGTLYVAFEEMVSGWPQVFVRSLAL